MKGVCSRHISVVHSLQCFYIITEKGYIMNRSFLQGALAVLVLFGLFSFFESLPKKNEKEEIFKERIVSKFNYAYRVFIPESWDGRVSWPVILFLHGKRERGEDNSSQTEVGLGRILKENSRGLPIPAIVVFPQCSENEWWTDSFVQRKVLAALFQAVKEFNGDTSKIYLTGISMGGYGVWSMAANYPNIFAAIAPVCGGIRSHREIPAVSVGDSADPYRAVAEKIKHIPVYIFHGRQDKVIPFSESLKMERALRKLGGRVSFNEYTFSGHDVWDSAYASENFNFWMMRQRKE